MNANWSHEGGAWKTATYCVVIAAMWVSSLFLIQGNVGLGLGDEGHLWYGVVQTVRGEVPIRDFRSYDPGRYYWGAAWSYLLGPGIMAVRTAGAFFQAAGLSLGLLAVSRVTTNRLLLALAGGLLVLWMFPRHKVYEHSVAMAAVFFAVFLLEKPTIKRHFAAGIFVGIAALIGRNLGVYLFLAFFCLILLAWIRTGKQCLAKRIIAWAVGLAIGYLPMVLMMAFVPGFFPSFIDSIYLMFGPNAPVLTRPIVWPWTVPPASLVSPRGLQGFTVGLFFVIMPFYYLWAIIYLLRKGPYTPDSALLVAGILVGIPLMHHVLVRPDVSHLAQGLHPFLISLIALPFALGRNRLTWYVFGLALFVAMTTLTIAAPHTIVPGLKRTVAEARGELSLVKYEIGGDTIWISKGQADYIEEVRYLVRQYVGSDESILIAPYAPGLYPILGRASPVWDPYPLFPVQDERQLRIIEDLAEKNVNWALISNQPLDGMDERRFSKTHGLVWQYLMERYVPVDNLDLPPEELWLHKRG